METMLQQALWEQQRLLEQAREEQRQFSGQLSTELCQHIDGLLAQEKERSEAWELRLKRQEQSLQDSVDRFAAQQNAMEKLRGAGTSVGFQRAPDQEELAQRLQDLTSANHRNLEDRLIKQVGEALSQQSRHRRGHVPEVRVNEGGPEEKRRPTHNAEELVLERQETQQTGSKSNNDNTSFYAVPSAEALKRSCTQAVAIDFASSLLILVNCAWMGVEAEVSFRAAARGELVPQFVIIVDAFFAVAFGIELAVRGLMQGGAFCKRPHRRMNTLDVFVVFLQVADLSAATLYNFAWLRSIRVIRLVNALKILRSTEYVKQLRLIVAAVGRCIQPVFWMFVVLAFLLFVVTVFLLQVVQDYVREASEYGRFEVDPELSANFGSVGACMLTLFKSISFGAPWEALFAPLLRISPLYSLVFLVYWCFVVLGCLNIFTAIFLESTKVIVQKDGNQLFFDAIQDESSPINKMKELLARAAKENSGFLTCQMLEGQLKSTACMKQMQALGVEHWEAMGVFQMLDADALGQVEVQQYVNALVKNKSKSEAVDLSTVLYENKRIFTRLLAFMRFTEDHFTEIQNSLYADGPQRSLEHYLPHHD